MLGLPDPLRTGTTAEPKYSLVLCVDSCDADTMSQDLVRPPMSHMSSWLVARSSTRQAAKLPASPDANCLA